jgi:hypothetical protein
MIGVSIADLGAVVNPAPGQRVLALLSAYIDASLANQPPRVTVVAGYVAPQDEWVRIEAEWQKGLDEWGLKYFHLAELPHQIGAERAELCERYFAGIIERSRLSAVSAALLNVDWENSDWGRDETARLSTPYEQCLDFALKVVGEFTNEVFPSEPVAEESSAAITPSASRIKRENTFIMPDAHGSPGDQLHQCRGSADWRLVGRLARGR